MRPIVVATLAFALMEAASYAAHRWVMHGFAMAWHRSHHAPPAHRWERNDLFPVCFSAVGVLLFSIGSLGVGTLWWVGLGVSTYGAAYLFVHELYIHRRLPIRLPRLRYLDWLRRAHRVHHHTGAEPYGMLLPLTRTAAPTRPPGSDLLDRSVRRRR